MLSPNHRFLEAEKIVEAGGSELAKHENPLVRLLYQRQASLAYFENELSRALDLYERKRQSRYLLEAMLMSPDGSIEKIVENMRVKRGVVDNYRNYFFDTAVFEDEFDSVDYVSELTDETERVTKKMALTEGYYYLLSHFNGKDLGVSPTEIAKKMQAFAYQMVTQARGSPLRSEAAKEAQKWASVVKTFTDSLIKTDLNPQVDFLAEFQVILKLGEPVKPITELPPEDVVRG